MNRRGEKGAVIIMVALFLLVLLTFVAFGTEAGRWYLVRAELSKTVDAAALAGAKNISNPNVDPRTLAEEFCQENFPPGTLSTPTSGAGTPTFSVEVTGNNRVQVNGHANAKVVMGRLLGVTDVPVSSRGAAAMRPVEILLVLDRSGSMQGEPIADLKVAAKRFLDYFTDTQSHDHAGLISFANAASFDHPLGANFVASMKTSIDAMRANGYTNPEDALDRADGPLGFTDQSGVPPSDRVQQFVVFFSDGRPNTFRSLFHRRGVTYDAVVHVNTNCDPGDNNQVVAPLEDPDTGQSLGVPARPTGDGVFPGSSCGAAVSSTKWDVLEAYPVPGYVPDACSIPDPDLGDHVCELASQFAVEHAQELKNRGIGIFVIGLGTRINTTFLDQIATGPAQVYLAPTSDDLQALFLRVAQEIKLRLVQ